MAKELEHANPYHWATNVKDALDIFEEALKARYRTDLDDHTQVWTLDGTKPSEEPTQGSFPSPNNIGIVYNNAKKKSPRWAEDVRAHIAALVPEFDTQDLNKIESAFEDLKNIQKNIGVSGGDQPDRETRLADLTNKINGRSGEARDFTEWAGISGDAFRNNFGQRVGPTMNNHTVIARSLGNLYAGRAGLIEAARENTLYAIKRAAKALNGTVETGEEQARWAIINAGIIAVGVANAGVGTALAIVAFIPNLIDTANPDREYKNDIEGIVSDLQSDLLKASSDVTNSVWPERVTKLQKSIAGAPRHELELYDFSRNGDSSGAAASGFAVEAEDVNRLARLCFEAAEEYEPAIKRAIQTRDADAELKGEYDVVTTGDSELKDTRDAFISLLQTTCARYYEAGRRLHEAARTYYGDEAENAEIMKKIDDRPDLNGKKDGKGSVDKHIGKTDLDDIKDQE